MNNHFRSYARLRVLSGFFALILLATNFSSVRAAEQKNYLPDGKPDFMTLLVAPPLPDSAEQAAELDEVLAVYHAANSNEMAIAYSQKKFSDFTFTPTIGGFFQSNNLPLTADFFQRVQKQAATVTDAAKDYYKRPRPFTADPSLANGKLEKSFGYPSGHSTEGTVLALVLAELFPEKREAIMAQGRAFGWHRVEIARHYLSDINAGRVLAQAIVQEMKSNPEFQKDLAAARAEIAQAQAAKK